MRSRKIEVKCDWCGRVIKKPPSLVKGRTNHFCSQKCHYELMRRKAKVRCDNCGELFEQRFTRSKQNKHNFCSRGCLYMFIKENPHGIASPTYHRPRGEDHPSWGGGPIEIECDFCGKKFKKLRGAYNKSNHHFCSQRCFGKWLGKRQSGENHPGYAAVSTKCDFCGREIKEIPSKIKRNKRHFCDMKCYGKWRSENIVEKSHPLWRGGKIPYYGPNWLRQRRKARARDNYTCQVCGRQEDGHELDVHHIISFREFELEGYKEANHLLNLITLCPPCHKKAERGDIPVDVLKGTGNGL